MPASEVPVKEYADVGINVSKRMVDAVTAEIGVMKQTLVWIAEAFGVDDARVESIRTGLLIMEQGVGRVKDGLKDL